MENLDQDAQESSSAKKQKSKKNWLIIVGILILVFGAAAFLVKEYQNNRVVESDSSTDAIESIFSVSQYNGIPENYKRFIYDFLSHNNYLDGTYFLTKIADRAKSVFAFGDFTDDDNDQDDMAVLFENNDYKSSMLVIFNHKGEGLLIKHYENELPIINSFKKGAKIFMDDSSKLVPAPCGGLIVKNGDSKNVLIYNKSTKKFDTYYQYTDADLANIEEESRYNEMDDEESPANIENDSIKTNN